MLKKLLVGTLLLGLSLNIHAEEIKKSVESTKTQKNIVVLETNVGKIELKLYPEVAPKAVENFMTHAKNGYYDGIIFHRVIKGFMIQGGDPTGTGRAGESIWKKSFDDEFAPNVVFDKPMLLAMANRGPKTNGSQFFITLAPTGWLNGKHTIFGEVVAGQDVVRKIENVSVSRGANKPLFPQTIKKAYVK
ncbi:MAG: Peptidyl-prolyl cis-trans isomerase (EC [uncultured Sulfurovum sp.]|uniref:Peptidyl-prolyl cis-trans isomerase n=1 Tax=uncultured Sulfurovum sp. TaxID=269237 RepID=A0A6S6SUH2_9BACT|nr:MAG: Peptidyl-prolyl cis-trans isomerase (EC [uncultured Sulfurovum sp.]